MPKIALAGASSIHVVDSTPSRADDSPVPVCVSVGPRRISIAPPAQQAAANLNRGRNLSIRRASLWSGGTLASQGSPLFFSKKTFANFVLFIILSSCLTCYHAGFSS